MPQSTLVSQTVLEQQGGLRLNVVQALELGVRQQWLETSGAPMPWVPLAEKLVVVGLAGLDLDGLHCGIDLFFPWDSQVLLDLFFRKGESPLSHHTLDFGG